MQSDRTGLPGQNSDNPFGINYPKGYEGWRLIVKDALRKLFNPRYPRDGLSEQYPIPPQHRHCGYCGAKMAKLPDGTGIKCTRCGNVIRIMID